MSLEAREAPSSLVGALFVAALVPRVGLALWWPETGGDSETYLTVAENIARHGCVSLSPPDLGACAPHWGGNHLPGYPALLALLQIAFGGSEPTIAIGQSALAALAVVYLVASLVRAGVGRRAATVAGGVLAFSPLGLPWSRFVLTDAVAGAISLWVLSELIRSYSEGRLRVVPLALAGTAAAFVRLDSVSLVIPVAAAAFVIHRPPGALWRGLVLTLLIALPLGGWWYRSVSAGLEPLPAFARLPDGWYQPVGYRAWGRTWLTNQYQYPGSDYPLPSGRYDLISIPSDAYRDATERQAVGRLLDELKAHVGRSFPEPIDRAFAAIAADTRAAEPFRQFLVLPLMRASALWITIFDSSGWPATLGPAARDRDVIEVAIEHLPEAVIKGITGIYRAGLIVGCLGLAAWSAWRASGLIRYVALLAALHALVRTAVLTEVALVEPRYLLQLVPWMEVVLALCLVRFLCGADQSSGVSAPMR